MQNYQEIWKTTLGIIELSISKANFNTWFKNTSITLIENTHVVIGVPNGFAKEWLENKYQSYIISSLKQVLPDVVSISCTIINSNQKNHPQELGENKNNENTNFKNSENNFNNYSNFSSNYRIKLNNRYTFDTFVVGENNELAKAACHAVYENLGKIYNPLFIYGTGRRASPSSIHDPLLSTTSRQPPTGKAHRPAGQGGA